MAFGSTRRVKGKVDDDATLRNLRRGRHVDGVHRRQVLGLPRHRSAADHARRGRGHGRRLGRVPAGPRPAGAVRRRALLRRLQAQPRVHACGCSRPRPSTAPRLPRAVRHQRRLAAARGRARSCARSSPTSATTSKIGVHLHDDTGCGVANALAGVRGGATQVQGTINGYGERTGNCNLTTIIPNLTLKMGVRTLPEGRLERLTPVAHHIAELVNITPNPQQPYVGTSAFAHKAGLHVSRHRPAPGRLRARRSRLGRQRHPLRRVGAGRQVDARDEGEGARPRARRQGAQRRRRRSSSELEHEGYHFEAADGSLELLMRTRRRLGAGRSSSSSRSG